jgi:hypothetical protein
MFLIKRPSPYTFSAEIPPRDDESSAASIDGHLHKCRQLEEGGG